jgi:hypothetical protein
VRGDKTFALLPMLAVLLVAIAHTDSASAATTLCKGEWDPAVCPAGERYPAGAEFKAPLRFAGFSEAKLVAGSLTVKCTASTLLFKTSEAAGAPLHGEVTEFTFGSCTGCTNVTAIHLNYAMELERTAPGNGSLTLKNAGGGNPAIKISGCPGGISCIYKAEALGAPIAAAMVTEIFFAKAPLTKESGGCAATEAFFSALYGIEQVRETPEQKWALSPTIWVEKA